MIIHQSLIKPVLVGGVEREFAIIVGGLSVVCWIIGKDLKSIFLALVIFSVGMLVGRVAGKIDPNLIKILLKHLRYQDYYSAKEKLGAPILDLNRL